MKKNISAVLIFVIVIVSSCSEDQNPVDNQPKIEVKKNDPPKNWLAEENPSVLYIFEEIGNEYSVKLKSDELILVNGTDSYKDVQIWNSSTAQSDTWFYQYSVRIYENDSKKIIIKMGLYPSNYRCRVEGDNSGFVPIKKGVIIKEIKQ